MKNSNHDPLLILASRSPRRRYLLEQAGLSFSVIPSSIDETSVLGKPGSRAEARTMLKQLSGQTHEVFTGYSICCEEKHRKFSETVKTEVLFKDLSDQEIEWYIHTAEPFDKAGAYAIQGLGTFLVKSINGSYTNVVGLPVCEVIEFLIKEGVLLINKITNNLES
jgi:septum formation protein